MNPAPATSLSSSVERLVAFLEGSWDLTADLPLAGGDPLADRLDAAWRRFRQTLLNALLEQESITAQSAAAAALNSIRTQDMQRRMREMEAGISQATTSLDRLDSTAERAEAAMQRSSGAVQETRSVTRSSMENASAMASTTAGIASVLDGAAGQLQELGRESKRIADLSKVVRNIATQVNMLSLNASIEAARAGAHGAGFAVVASEVRRLAENTSRQAAQIDGVVGQVADQLRQADQQMAVGAAQAQHLAQQAASAAQGASAVETLVEQVSAPFQELTAAMRDHTGTLEAVRETVTQSAGHVQSVAQHVNLVAAESQSLLALSRSAQSGLARFHKGSHLDEIKATTGRMAQELAGVFESAIDAGRITLEEALALAYTEIKGPAVHSLRRLFDVSRVPTAGFNPPKFSTRYDHAVDLALREVLDRYLASARGMLFTTVVDLNAYQPISTSNTCQAWTGDFRRDAMGNRLKRFSTDQAQLDAAQMGLKVPPLTLTTPEPYVRNPESILTRERLRQLGNSLLAQDEPKDLFTVYTYASLSGKVATQVAVPLYIKGHRYGAAMIGWEPKVSK